MVGCQSSCGSCPHSFILTHIRTCTRRVSCAARRHSHPACYAYAILALHIRGHLRQASEPASRATEPPSHSANSRQLRPTPASLSRATHGTRLVKPSSAPRQAVIYLALQVPPVSAETAANRSHCLAVRCHRLCHVPILNGRRLSLPRSAVPSTSTSTARDIAAPALAHLHPSLAVGRR